MSLYDAEYELLPSMLSGILPSASSSTKSGSSKPSSRFSVRIFKTPSNVPIPYPIDAKFDVGYRPGQAEQPWYPTSINAPYEARPRATANYVIYPSAHNDTFIYQQSAASKSDIFSNSEFEISTATFSSPSAFSPALSTDSTTTLKSPSAPDLTVSDTLSSSSAPSSPQTPRLAYPLPAVTPSLQGPVLSKTPSARPYMHEAAESIEERRTRLPALQSHTAIPFRPPSRPNGPMTQTGPRPGGYPIETPDYAASTLSELEVEERDRIAQINAGYNSASTGSFYASSTGSSSDKGTHLVSTTPQNQRTTSSQPLHPTNLPFPIRPQEHDFSHSHSVFPRSSHPNGPAHPALRDSPPSVERLPSQVPSEQLVSQNTPQLLSSFSHTLQKDNRSRDATVDSNSRSQNAHYPPRSASTASSKSHLGSSRPVQEVAGNAPFSNRFPSSSDHPPQHSIADRRSPIAGGRVDVKDYGVPSAGPDYRTNDTADPTRGLAEPTRILNRGALHLPHKDPYHTLPRKKLLLLALPARQT
ncbi:hypothetical protein NLJ89_g2621 [Agrocybe chaxingu]|uniref:Uncharacterized protein n=1 Tax=Agrocybe chaxingu TaxID=84603 RepID=A0A9W8K752_9AGAR|nr:hypothetical protein NLJ89_g2621 [Agrocybe chaxingu]